MLLPPNGNSLIPELPTEEPYGYATEWLIASKSEAGASYLVDLAANKGWGECQCRWYLTTYLPILRRGNIPPRSCSHIADARVKFARWACTRFAALDPNKPQ
jgi:hypothetical protein